MVELIDFERSLHFLCRIALRLIAANQKLRLENRQLRKCIAAMKTQGGN